MSELSTGDDWGDEPRQSIDAIEAEEVLDTLYPDDGDAKSKEPEPEPVEAKAPAPAPAEDTDDDGAMWSTEDVELIRVVESEHARFQHDLQSFAQIKAADIDQLSGGDKGQAAAIRAQIADAERELKQRHEALTAAGNQLRAKVETRNMTKAEKRLAAERAKLEEHVPDLDKAALKTYLKAKGFNDDEIRQANDHRIVAMAEKARRYDEMTSGKRPKTVKVPRLVKGAKPRQSSEPVTGNVQELRQRLGIPDATNTLYGPPQKRKTSIVEELKAERRRRTGKRDVLDILYKD